MTEEPSLRIDVVSDVSCPWCAVGLSALLRAVEQTAGDVAVDLHLQPFELNPQMGPGGQDITEHLTGKYGSTPAQQAQIRDTIRQRGAAEGFTFRPEGRGRIYNTFDAHRLLHWAEGQGEGRQVALKMALLAAYFTDGQDPSSHEVLLAAARKAGLDADAAREVLASDAFADEVRAAQALWQQAGIHAVPAVVLNQRHLLSGAQSAETYAQAIRQVAQAAARPATTAG